MPIHDWTRVDAGLFHHFHQEWAISLCNALNAESLPADYFALVEQNIRGPLPEVLTLRSSPHRDAGAEPGVDLGPAPRASSGGGVAVTTRVPRTRLMRRVEIASYLRKASRITVRHRHGDVVAVIEIVSPGNKASRAEFRTLVEKSADLIRQGIHLLVIDLFPPGKRDPQGVHKAIWDEFQEEELDLPPDTPLTLASYDAGSDCVAYVEFLGVGDCLPNMPLFLRPEFYVPVPLEATYQTAWSTFPAALKGLLDNPLGEAAG
jgi:hypothetical protein